MFEHLHNKIIHFPIAFIIAGFLFTLLGFKDGKYVYTIKILVTLAAIAGVAAFFTGNNQADVFIGDPKEWVMLFHRTIGLITVISTIIWTAFLFINSLNKYAWIFALISIGLVSIAAFFGGIVAH